MFLTFFGIDIPKHLQGKNWTKGFIDWLEKVRPGGLGDVSFGILMKEYILLKEQRTELLKRIDELANQQRYRGQPLCNWQKSTPMVEANIKTIRIKEFICIVERMCKNLLIYGSFFCTSDDIHIIL